MRALPSVCAKASPPPREEAARIRSAEALAGVRWGRNMGLLFRGMPIIPLQETPPLFSFSGCCRRAIGTLRRSAKSANSIPVWQLDVVHLRHGLAVTSGLNRNHDLGAGRERIHGF